MRIIALAVSSVIFCIGCQTIGGPGSTGDGDSEHSADVSGSRLKRRVLNTGDGARQFIGWFDTERGENCTFRKVEWNVDRCIPDEHVVEAQSVREGVLFFSDSACTKRIAVLASESIFDCDQGLVSKYVVDDQKISCKQTDFSIFQIGDRLADPDDTTTVKTYSLDDGECVEAGEVEANRCAALTPVPLDAFVEGGEWVE
jgi:hypothetical protein